MEYVLPQAIIAYFCRTKYITNQRKIIEQMKKTFILLMAWLMAAATVSLKAQNRVENPGFENWTAGEPTPWTTSGGAITLTENTANSHGGNANCKVVFTSQSNQNLKSNTFSVTPGETLAGSVWVLDNDVAGRARISLIFEGASNYYGAYSEDNADWQELSFNEVVPEGATAATFQVRFYDVSASWDGDCEILVDDASCGTNSSVNPEPTNYPTAFAAAAERLNIDLSWTDATGAQEPDGYLLLGSTTDNISAPVDGTAVDNDLDIADGSFAANIAAGKGKYFVGMQNGVTLNKNYYFKIYPYTNGGNNIDYKTDGSTPAANASTPNTYLVMQTTFATDLDNWTAVSVTGDEQTWTQGSYQGLSYAMMSGYASGASNVNEDWLISPDISIYNDMVFSFRSARNFDGPALELMYSNDYTTGNPNSATWTPLTATWSDGSYNWVASGNISLPNNGGLRIAYKYTSTDTQSPKWEVTDILITGTEDTPNPATQLDIVNINGGNPVYANQGFSLQVKALNADGNVANVSSDVNVNISVKTGTGALVGTTTGTIANGSNMITINGISYNKAENGVVLQVNDAAGSLSAGDSDAFDVIATTAPQFVITEIMYNPPEAGEDSLEYIEIYNNSTEATNLEACSFTKGVEFTFPSISLAPAGYLVIAKDSAAMQRQFGVAARQWTSGSLKNSGEAIVLSAADGTVIDSVSYDDSAPWPKAADGDGPSLSICNPLADNSLAESWHASTNFLPLNSGNDTIWGSPTMAPAPVANFTSNMQSVSAGGQVQFTQDCSCNATSYEWTFEGGTPASSTEANPSITYNAGGAFDVTLKAINSTGSDTIVMKKYITVYDGIAENSLAHIGLSPNPSASGYFNIHNPQQQTIAISVYDIMGKRVIPQYYINNDTQIDLSAQESGIYFLQMTTEGQHKTLKIIKK